MREELRIALTEDRRKARRVKNGETAIFKVKIRYKSGASEEFWTRSFDCDGNGNWTWNAIEDENRPLLLGVDNIESVWQVATDVLTDAEVKEFFG